MQTLNARKPMSLGHLALTLITLLGPTTWANAQHGHAGHGMAGGMPGQAGFGMPGIGGFGGTGFNVYQQPGGYFATGSRAPTTIVAPAGSTSSWQSPTSSGIVTNGALPSGAYPVGVPVSSYGYGYGFGYGYPGGYGSGNGGYPSGVGIDAFTGPGGALPAGLGVTPANPGGAEFGNPPDGQPTIRRSTPAKKPGQRRGKSSAVASHARNKTQGASPPASKGAMNPPKTGNALPKEGPNPR